MEFDVKSGGGLKLPPWPEEAARRDDEPRLHLTEAQAAALTQRDEDHRVALRKVLGASDE